MDHKKAKCRHLANGCAEQLRHKCDVRTQRQPIGVVLGTGWQGCLELTDVRTMPLEELQPFGPEKPCELHGQPREVVVGSLPVEGIRERRIVALKNRIHLNEALSIDDCALKVRLQIEMLLMLGIRTFVLTTGVRSLLPDNPGERPLVGSVVVANGVNSCFAPQMPLFSGETQRPKKVLDPGLLQLALDRGQNHPELSVRAGGHCMVLGPNYEDDEYDTKFMALTGASVVGTSILPELCVIATERDTRALVLGHIMNLPEERRARQTDPPPAEPNPLLRAYLTDVLADIIRSM